MRRLGARRLGASGARPLAALLVCALAAALGCAVDDGETCEIATQDISAVALVVDSGWDVRATIDFEAGDRRGANSPLRLCSTDRLTINGQDPVMTEKADRIEYALSLPADGARSFDFRLERETEAEVIEMSIELPAVFEVVAPMDGEIFETSAEHLVQWEPALDGGMMRLRLGEPIGGGECLVAMQEGHTYETEAGVLVPDTGQWTIPAGVLTSQSTTDCTLTYTLSRVALAPYPEVLQRSGRVEARTERYVDVTVLP
ncbi:hypothetical protein [Paraliomyxa miuraensis]|uniref:hypothetical protein n=1 Tax=Paraliomyxa miuraensis TaxID=376150 RepID=UPI00224EB078|nr:hypothetical protein [Paraliomyxa miuraensis]MCX4248080.1 hypothetical protein [Paraliomyxa miuraensis]